MRLKICREDELSDGGVKTLRVMARTVAVFRISGNLYGLEADCKHMRASIASGSISGTTITCPAHGWKYNIVTGDCLNEPWAKLKTYPVEVQDGWIWVEI